MNALNCYSRLQLYLISYFESFLRHICLISLQAAFHVSEKEFTLSFQSLLLSLSIQAASSHWLTNCHNRLRFFCIKYGVLQISIWVIYPSPRRWCLYCVSTPVRQVSIDHHLLPLHSRAKKLHYQQIVEQGWKSSRNNIQFSIYWFI